MTSICQSPPTSTSSYPSLPVGLDVGNGSTKMVIKGDERRILSYVLPPTVKFTTPRSAPLNIWIGRALTSSVNLG